MESLEREGGVQLGEKFPLNVPLICTKRIVGVIVRYFYWYAQRTESNMLPVAIFVKFYYRNFSAIRTEKIQIDLISIFSSWPFRKLNLCIFKIKTAVLFYSMLTVFLYAFHTVEKTTEYL